MGSGEAFIGTRSAVKPWALWLKTASNVQRRSLSTRRQSLGVAMHGFSGASVALLLLSLMTLCNCQDLVPRDTSSLLIPRFSRSEILGFVIGFGTTFAAMPELIAMHRRQSSAGMNPRMVAIMGVFQILWVYYGLLIASRPVIVWNVIAVFINSLNVIAYFHLARRKEAARRSPADACD